MKRIPTPPRAPNPHGKLNEAACRTHRIYKRALRRAYDKDNRRQIWLRGSVDRWFLIQDRPWLFTRNERCRAVTLDRIMYQVSGEKHSCRHYHPHFEASPRWPRVRPLPGTKNGYVRHPACDGEARIPFLANITPKPMRKAHIRKWKREEEKQTAEYQKQVNGCVYASRSEAENIKAAIALQDGIYPVPAGTPVHFVLVGGMDVSTARPVTMTIDTSEGETEELTEEELTEESRP